jgi:cell shape-determining protein MreD
MRATLALTLCCAVLQAVLAEANHALSPLHVGIMAAGLCVPVAALSMPFGTGLAACGLAGALLDAWSPLPFGTQALALMAAQTVVHSLRHRLPREENMTRVSVALVVNLAVFGVLTAATLGRNPAPGSAWPRLGTDLVLSQAVVVLLGPWFAALQARALGIALVAPAPGSTVLR